MDLPPAILTGVAAIITAVATLLGVLYEREEAPRIDSDEPPMEQPAPAERQPQDDRPLPRLIEPDGIQVGETVLAMWEDRCFYRASVLDVSNGRYHVYYEFSESTWVQKEAIFSLERSQSLPIDTSARVLVRVPSPNNPWVPGSIAAITNSHYVVLLEGDHPCAPEKRQIRAPAADVVVVK